MKKRKPLMTWREGLNILAAVMVFLTILIWHGTRPRDEEVEVIDVPVVGVEYDIVPVASNKYELGPDVFANNFDTVPDIDLDEVIEHLIRVENPGRDVNAVGDKHLTHKAYGILQIRKPYLDDVNKIAGTSYTIEDMKDTVKARWAAKIYLNHYGETYERKTGEAPTLEVYARIHNGGPNGWKKASTNDYVRKLNGGLK
jgi:hypothetical protein